MFIFVHLNFDTLWLLLIWLLYLMDRKTEVQKRTDIQSWFFFSEVSFFLILQESDAYHFAFHISCSWNFGLSGNRPLVCRISQYMSPRTDYLTLFGKDHRGKWSRSIISISKYVDLCIATTLTAFFLLVRVFPGQDGRFLPIACLCRYFPFMPSTQAFPAWQALQSYVVLQRIFIWLYLLLIFVPSLLPTKPLQFATAYNHELSHLL